MTRVRRSAVALLVLGGFTLVPACSGGSGDGGAGQGRSASPGIVFITGSGATGVSGVSGDTGFVPGSVGEFEINSQTYRVHEIGYIRTILAEGTGADRQLRVFGQTGDLKQVMDYVIAETERGIFEPAKALGKKA